MTEVHVKEKISSADWFRYRTQGINLFLHSLKRRATDQPLVGPDLRDLFWP